MPVISLVLALIAFLLGYYVQVYILWMATVGIVWVNYYLSRQSGLAAMGMMWSVPMSVVMLLLMWGAYLWNSIDFSVIFLTLKELILR